MLCPINQSIKVYHHLIDHSYSQNRVTIQQIVTTLQQIVTTFPQTVITLSEDIRFVRKLVNRGSKRYQRFVYRYNDSLIYVDLSESGQSVANVL
jgi:hypothetical protein